MVTNFIIIIIIIIMIIVIFFFLRLGLMHHINYSKQFGNRQRSVLLFLSVTKCTFLFSKIAFYWYFLQVPANHLITASVMSAPAALAISKLAYPETERTRKQDFDKMGKSYDTY